MTNISSRTICFVGLGMMGAPMAALLRKAGFPLLVADADASRARGFAADHGAAQISLTETTPLNAGVAVTMLPNSGIVEEVVLGAGRGGGLAARLQPGSLVIDMSSSEPLRSRELATELAARGLRYLDAPVSGGVKKAVEGTLAIMVGGEPGAFEAAGDILRCMGSSIVHVGEAGAGHAVKALNNYVSASGLVAAVDALRVGKRFGIDPATVLRILNASSGRNNATENKVAQFMLNGKFDSGFSVQLMVKDLRIAQQLAQDMQYPMPMGAECLAIWAGVADKLDRIADHTEMYALINAQLS